MKPIVQRSAKCLSVSNVCKSYGNKTVLKNITCDFPAGNFFALLGENGAGKSTLASLICGEKSADSGTILFTGIKTCTLVHQRPLLADSLTVRDNIILGSEPVCSLPFLKNVKTDFIDFSAAHKKIEDVLHLWNIDADIGVKASSLSAAERFYAAFAASAYKNPDVFILDEPGSVLNETQKHALYPALRNFARSGRIVILITHQMSDALEYADSLVLLRAGKEAVCMSVGDKEKTGKAVQDVLYGGKTEGQTKAAPPFAGTPVKAAQNEDEDENKNTGAPVRQNPDCAQAVLSVEHLSCAPSQGGALNDIGFKVYARKITCIYGHRANGLETLENLITGMKNYAYTGTVAVNGKAVKPSPRLLRDEGCGIVPFNRTFRGSDPELSVEQILTVHLKPADKIKNADYARCLIERAGITIGTDEKASALSGGMLQRLIIERETAENRKLLILSEPERGLDSRAVQALFGRLCSLAESGTAVLLFISAGSPDVFPGDYRFFLRGGRLYEA